jgi:tetratricopeptide (TPR) repeat protein
MKVATRGQATEVGASQTSPGAEDMLQIEDWRAAIESSRRILQADPDNLGALETLARAEWFGGDYDAVIATTSRLLRLNPLEPGYRYTRGMAHLGKGELSRAYDDFTTAIAQSGDEEFKAHVASSLDAVERWMSDRAAERATRFAGAAATSLGRVN